MGARRLQPLVNELVDQLKSCGEIRLHPDTEGFLRQASAATLQRCWRRFGVWLHHMVRPLPWSSSDLDQLRRSEDMS